ncbi:MAG TPA: VWA domain-containing protein [Chitinophagaceae bacterium]|nr:VWA domain-containing protein [Chitinophagaceae bacterium]
MPSLQYPLLLWSLLLIPFLLLLYAGYALWRRRKRKRLGDPRLVTYLLRGHSPVKSGVKLALVLVSVALGCLALTNPRSPEEGASEARKGIDILIALDVSNSMMAEDIAPSRLERAKSMVTRLIDASPNDRFGLLTFAGHAYLQMPLSFDHNAARMYLAAADPSMIKAQGTAMTEALEKAALAFDPQAERFKAIILISDGEAHDAEAVAKAQELAGNAIMVYTVGVGSPEGATITDPATGLPRRDASGKVVVSQLNERLLMEIAAATRGQYLELTGSEAVVKALLAQLGQIEKKALADTSLMNFTPLYPWLVAPMLLLLMAELFIPERKKILA